MRREELCAKLQEIVEVGEGNEHISQAILLQLLKMSVADKSRLTRAIKQAYPLSKKKKVPEEDGTIQYPLSMSKSYTCHTWKLKTL